MSSTRLSCRRSNGVGILLASVMLLLPSGAGRVAAGEAAVTVRVDARQPGVALHADALGLSYETSRMLPDDKGVRYFRPGNVPLVTTFKTLGIKSLRIGGNSTDSKRVPIPEEADVASLFEFARAAGVKVIYSVRLEDGDPQAAAKVARFIHDGYADVLDSFAIGNEPYYYKQYDVYRAKWSAIRDAIVAAVPDARFCGPDQNPTPELFANVVRDFGNADGRLVELTVHSYPFGCAYRSFKQVDITKLDPSDPTTSPTGGPVLTPFDAAESRDKMLSPTAYAEYEKIRQGVANAIAGTNVSYRLTETNSFWFSGLKGASDSYASALWGVDYLHWWTSHGAAGVNFHTGDRTGGTVTLPCRYAVFVTSEKGYEVRPLGYGLKLFDLGRGAKVLPVTVSATKSDANLVAYATLADDGKTLAVTVVNKSHGPAAGNVDVQIQPDAPLASTDAPTIFLTATNGDIAGGSSAVKLGGAPIKEDGTWNGHWTPLPVGGDGAINVTMPSASAAVIKVALK